MNVSLRLGCALLVLAATSDAMARNGGGSGGYVPNSGAFSKASAGNGGRNYNGGIERGGAASREGAGNGGQRPCRREVPAGGGVGIHYPGARPCPR